MLPLSPTCCQPLHLPYITPIKSNYPRGYPTCYLLPAAKPSVYPTSLQLKVITLPTLHEPVLPLSPTCCQPLHLLYITPIKSNYPRGYPTCYLLPAKSSVYPTSLQLKVITLPTLHEPNPQSTLPHCN